MQPEDKKKVWVNFIFYDLLRIFLGLNLSIWYLYDVYDYCNTFYYGIIYKNVHSVFYKLSSLNIEQIELRRIGLIKEHNAVMTAEIKFSGLKPLFSWLKALNSFEILKLFSFKATV